jgi:hypothetical protein
LTLKRKNSNNIPSQKCFLDSEKEGPILIDQIPSLREPVEIDCKGA